MRAEECVNSGEKIPIPRTINGFEIAIWNFAVLNQFGINQHHAFVHRIAGAMVFRRKCEKQDGQANCREDEPQNRYSCATAGRGAGRVSSARKEVAATTKTKATLLYI